MYNQCDKLHGTPVHSWLFINLKNTSVEMSMIPISKSTGKGLRKAKWSLLPKPAENTSV